MSLRRCIPEMLGDGRLNDDQAQRLGGLYDELERDYASKFGQQAGEAMASKEAVDRFQADALHKRRQATLQIAAQQQIAMDVARFRKDNPGAAAEALLTNDDRAPYFNVDFRAEALATQHFAMMNGLLEKFSRNGLGRVRNHALLMNVVREAFGEHTGDISAHELARAWMDTAESLRLHFNAAGGAIGKLDKWGMPQVHNMLAVRAVPFDEWRGAILPLLDRERMLDASGHALTPQQLEFSLRDVYEAIVSDGWNRREAGAFSGSKLGNRHAASRFLTFKDADSWLTYMKRFGRPLSAMSGAIDPDGAVFDTMFSHIKSMSRDIALMQRLGPNPTATLRWIKDGLMKEATESKHAGSSRIKRAKGSRIRLDNIYNQLTGGFEIENEGLASAASGVRAWESASKLGGAMLSSLGDAATQFVTRRFNGLPAARVLSDYVGSLKPHSAADRAHAARRLSIAREAVKTMGAYSRWTGETMRGEVAARLSDGVMHASYLSKWTDDGLDLFNRSVWAGITDNAGRAWQTLDKPFRGMLDRYGFTPADWDKIRLTPLVEDHGAQWILPENIKDSRLTTRLAEMILTESEYAVPTSSTRIQAAINARLHKGSIPGEIGRTLLQFRGFPIQLFWMHGRRALQNGPVTAVKYAATLYVASTLMGALAQQLKDVAAGKDPEPMFALHDHMIRGHTIHNVPDFWLKASLQGSGFGILTDFVNSATSRYGQSFWLQQLGPTVGTIDDAVKLAWAKNKPPALRRLIESNTPGSTIWYLRTLLHREISDQMQMHADPDYQKSFDRIEKRARKDGTDFWWAPGKQAPQRAPDMANTIRQ